MSLIEKAMQSAARREAKARAEASHPVTAGTGQPHPAEPVPAPAAAPAAAAPPGPPPPAPPPAAPAPLAFRRTVEQQPGLERAHFNKLQSELKYLKRSVIKAAFSPLAEPDARTISLASAMPGAGKTFLALQLGYSLAQERDRRVVLVDGDNARSSLTRQLEVRQRPGFYDLLHDPALALGDVLLDTDCAGLRVIPSGNHCADAVELINSDRARSLLAALLAEDPGLLVLIDGPPLLVSPDALALSGLAGQVLMVVEAGHTSDHDLDQALDMLDENKPVGLVLNKIPDSRLLDYRGGDYYYYGDPAHERPTAAVPDGRG